MRRKNGTGEGSGAHESVMWRRRSSVPKCSMLIRSRWPQLQSIARRQMIPNCKSMSPELLMSMVHHRRGSFEMVRHTEDPCWARMRVSIAPSFWKMVHSTSRGRSFQFRSSRSAPTDFTDDDDDIGLKKRERVYCSSFPLSPIPSKTTLLLSFLLHPILSSFTLPIT